MNKGFLNSIVLGVLIAGAIVFEFLCAERIPAEYVGEAYTMSGGVDGEVLTLGWHIESPTKKVTKYSIGIEQSYLSSEDKGDLKKDESFNIPTSDGKTVKDIFIKPKIMAWLQKVSATYPVTEIFEGKRTKINFKLEKYLKQKFETYRINIDAETLRIFLLIIGLPRLSRKKQLHSRNLNFQKMRQKRRKFKQTRIRKLH